MCTSMYVPNPPPKHTPHHTNQRQHQAEGLLGAAPPSALEIAGVPSTAAGSAAAAAAAGMF